MRRIAIAGVAGLLVVAGGIRFAASRIEAYLDDNREWLIERAAAALGRDVRFGELGVSLFGPGVEVTQVTIGDDPSFSDGAFVEVDRAVVAVKLLPAIFGRYELSRVLLDAPRVTVIRAAEGFNFQSIAGGSGGGATPEQVPLRVSDLRIRGGSVRVVDRAGSSEAEVLVEQIDLSASDVGFDSEMGIELAAAVLGAAEQNVTIDGTVGPLGAPDRVLETPLDLDFHLGPVIIDGLREVPIVRDWVPADLSSDDPITLVAGIDGTIAEPTVVASLDATGAVIEYGQFLRKPGGVTLVADANLAVANDALRVGALTLHIADATVRAEGTVGFDEKTPIDVRLTGGDIALAGLADLVPAAEGLEIAGRVDVDVRASGPLSSAAPRLDGSVTLTDVRAARPGGVDVSGLSMRVAFNGDQIEIPATRFMVAGEPVELSATVASLNDGALPHLSVRAMGGELTGTGAVAAVDGESTFEIRGRVDGMDVASILDFAGASQLQMTGVVEGDFRLRSSKSHSD